MKKLFMALPLLLLLTGCGAYYGSNGSVNIGIPLSSTSNHSKQYNIIKEKTTWVDKTILNNDRNNDYGYEYKPSVRNHHSVDPNLNHYQMRNWRTQKSEREQIREEKEMQGVFLFLGIFGFYFAVQIYLVIDERQARKH